jgi:hypothetical protein
MKPADISAFAELSSNQQIVGRLYLARGVQVVSI